MIDIRPALESDASGIAVLLDQLGHPSSPQHIRQQLMRIGVDDLEAVIVAVEQDTIAGMLALQISAQFHQEPPLARVIDLCVLKNYRGKGVGRLLLVTAEKIARKKKCCKLEVTSNNTRKQAHLFYEHNKFKSTHRYFAKTL
jgi:ribosomal protein S18 acetylase RimI-like enzyme